MKLSNPFRGDTASRIENARQALSAAEARIAELEARRRDALADSDEDIGAIDREIDEQRRAGRTFRDRLAVLQTKLAEEAEQSRQRAYEAGVAAIERLLPRREAAAKAVEEAIVALGSSVSKYDAVTETIRHEWPGNTVPRPGTNHGGYFSPYLLNLHRLDECLRRVLGAGPSLRDIVRRVSDAGGRAEGFTESERNNSATLLKDLRQRGAPKPVVADDDVEEAA
jgi:hypothetical protein